MTDRDHPSDRLELHNASVDEDLAQVGACGQIHLPTGLTCTQPHHHRGSCVFAAPERASKPDLLRPQD
jgi:hypothetical protein